MAGRDEVTHAEPDAYRNHDGKHHGESGVDSARNEVRRENRGVPTGYYGDGEVEGNDGVHRDHEGSRHTAEQQVGHFVAIPVTGRSAPTEGEDTVEEATNAFLAAIPQGRQIRNQTRVPEEQGHRKIGRDGEHVPQQRGAKLGPQRHGVGQREDKEDSPGSTHVKQRENTCAHHGKEGHRLRKAVNSRSPVLVKQEQDSGNKGSGVSNTDPPDQVHNSETPANGVVDTPKSETFPEQVAGAGSQDSEKGKSDGHRGEPRLGHGLFQDDVTDGGRDRLVVMTGLYQGGNHLKGGRDCFCFSAHD